MAQIIYRNVLQFTLVAFVAATVAGCATNAVIPDPCSLITLDEIRRIAPEAASANALDNDTEGSKIRTCVWKNNSGADQIRLTSKAADGSPVEAALKALMRTQPAVRVAAVPSVGPDAAAAFSGSGDGEIMTILIAQNEQVFLDLRPQGAGVRGEKSQGFAIAASLLKTALERGKK